MKTVYVAGPYTQGNTIQNIRMAIEAGEALANAGFAPFIPHLTAFWDMLHEHPVSFWYAQDNEWLRHCDVLLRLRGESQGADAEVQLAKQLGKAIYHNVFDLIATEG